MGVEPNVADDFEDYVLATWPGALAVLKALGEGG